MIRGSRSHWARRPSTVLLLGLVWVTICAYIILKKAHIDTSRYNFHLGALQPVSSSRRADSILQTSSSVPAAAAATARCKASLPNPDVVQSRFADSWGHICVPLRQTCYDEGTYVMYHPSNHPSRGGKAPKDPLPLGNNYLEFRDLGDVYGIEQYPKIIFRPNNSDEEVADLQNPSFTNCSRPVVLYLNHLYMFGDFMITTMPTFMNAINSGAWDRSHTLVIATGGQKLQQWQKLMLQPLTEDPVMTLSVASSRAVPLLQQQQVMQEGQQRRRLVYETAVRDTPSKTSSSGSSSSIGWHRHLQERVPTASGATSGSSSAGGKGPQPQRPWKHWQQQSYQWQQQSAGSAVHKLPHKQQQRRRRRQLPQQWQQWQQQWRAWKQTAPAVANITAAAAAALSQQQQRLHTLQRELVDPNPPVTSYGRCFESLTVCSIQAAKRFSRPVPHPVWSGAHYISSYWTDRYGAQYKQLADPLSQQLQQPRTLRVVFAVRGDTRVRRVLNLEALLRWCNDWKPIDQHNVLSSKYSKTVCVAYEFGKHGEVHTKPQQQQKQQQQQEAEVQSQAAAAAVGGPGLMVRWHDSVAEAVGTVMGFMSGRHQRQLLEATTTRRGSQSSRQLKRAEPGSIRTAGQPVSLSSSRSPDAGVATTHELPLDPDLDPRALLADLAVLDESDVVVGVHGAQLFNALFMPQHKSLVEVRPYQFTGGWPDGYFQHPLVIEDKSDGIFWWGIDTTKPQNSAPGYFEQAGTGCCYARDRHTQIDPKSLEYVLRRIIWCDGSSDKYQQLHSRNETHITDTLQKPAVKDNQQQKKQKRRENQNTSKEQQQQQTHTEEDAEQYVEDVEEAYWQQQQQDGYGDEPQDEDGYKEEDEYFVKFKVAQD